MWIPHFSYEFWELESSRESDDKSRKDKTERKFDIRFYLEDSPSKLIQDSCFLLSEPIDKLQTDANGRSVAVRFQPNNKGRLCSIYFKVLDNQPKNAFRYCYNQLSKLLSVWALSVGTGFAIYGIYIIDETHSTKWKVVPQKTQAEEFWLPLGIGLNDEYSALISLYREGRNSNSPFYRFLCFYKILEAWYKNKSLFSIADRTIKENGLTIKRKRRRITKEMLVLSLNFHNHPEFEGKTFAEFYQLLNPHRVKVAHAITDSGTFINFDDYDSMLNIAPIANLADLVCQQIIQDDLDLWDQIRNTGVKL